MQIIAVALIMIFAFIVLYIGVKLIFLKSLFILGHFKGSRNGKRIQESAISYKSSTLFAFWDVDTELAGIDAPVFPKIL